MAGNDVICGGDGADRILGLRGNDRLYGVDGNDCLDGNQGNDRISGGEGKDFIVSFGASSTVLAASVTNTSPKSWGRRPSAARCSSITARQPGQRQGNPQPDPAPAAGDQDLLAC